MKQTYIIVNHDSNSLATKILSIQLLCSTVGILVRLVLQDTVLNINNLSIEHSSRYSPITNVVAIYVSERNTPGTMITVIDTVRSVLPTAVNAHAPHHLAAISTTAGRGLPRAGSTTTIVRLVTRKVLNSVVFPSAERNSVFPTFRFRSQSAAISCLRTLRCTKTLKVDEIGGIWEEREVGEGEEDVEDSRVAGVSEEAGDTGWGSYLDFVWS